MNPISYTLNTQKILLSLFFASIAGIGFVTIWIDPTNQTWVVYILLALLTVFFATVITLLAFWWVFFIRKEIVSITQINKILGQGAIGSLCIVTLISLYQTRLLDIYSICITLSAFIFYTFWINTD